MPRPPNILLITSDQQHWNTLGRYFSELKTPHLDRLADSGLAVRRAYCTNPTCTPSRASILTGQYPSRHGAWSLGTKLDEGAETLPRWLSRAGYDSALIGKAHFQQLRSSPQFPSIESHPLVRDREFWRAFHGPWYGFDHVELARNHGDEAHVGQHYALWLEDNGLSDWRRHFQSRWEEFDYSEGGAPNPPQRHAWSLPGEFHMNRWITERSLERIHRSRRSGKPFFLWASYFDPHPPYLVPQPWASMYDPREVTVPAVTPGEHDRNPPHLRKTQQADPDFSDLEEATAWNHGCASHCHDRDQLARDIAVYYGMVSMLDHSIGQLLDGLGEAGLSDDTLVVFTSDHGHYYGHHGLIAKGPFHYEDGIRLPFLARWPGRIPERSESQALLSLADLAPTFLAAAGVGIPRSVQGVDQLQVWCGRSERARDHLLVEHRHQPTAIHMKSLVEGRYKLTLYYNREYGELFDLAEDPGEIHNLWDEPDAGELKQRLIRRLLDAQLAAEPLPMPRLSVA